MDKPANKSLFEVLQQKAKAHRGIIVADPDCNLLTDHLALERAYYAAAELAKPYEARLAALERVADSLREVISICDICDRKTDIFERAKAALAVVPPLPEVQDGS